MKSYAREVAGGVGILIIILTLYIFFLAAAERIKALEGIFMGFLSPIGLMCLGAFIHKSWQQHLDTRVDAAKKL